MIAPDYSGPRVTGQRLEAQINRTDDIV